MKAYVIEDFSGIEGVHPKEIRDPKIEKNEVLISIEAASINPVDWKIADGLLKDRMPYEFPITLGWDVAGIIEEVGQNVHEFKKGDRVYAYSRSDTIHQGTFTEKITLPESSVAVIPKTFTFAQAAAVPLTALTAWQAIIDFCDLKKGETILIHAAAGGVGSFAVQFAKYYDAFVIGTASKKNHPYVKNLGADDVIDYQNRDIFSTIKSEYPEGIDVILDTLGGESLIKSFSLLKRGGRLVSIVTQPDPSLSEKYGVKSGSIFVEPNQKQLKKFTSLFEKKILRVPEIHERSFEKIKEALKESKEGHVQGKLVLTRE